MPVEFALRPRIRLREGFTPQRRSRWRLPRYVLPVAAYWLAAAGLVYAFVHSKDRGSTEPSAEAKTTETATETARAWWEPTPAPAPSATAIAAVPNPEPASVPLVAEPATEAAPSSDEQGRAPAPALPREAPAREAAPPVAARPYREEPPSWHDTAPSIAALASERDQREPSDEPPPPLPAPTPLARSATRAGALPSCEAATAAANQDVDFSAGNRGADLPTSAIAAVLENGAWLGSCSLPTATSLDVCVAIKGGTVTGVSVVARPANPALETCVARRAAALQFPYSPRLDVARTRF